MEKLNFKIVTVGMVHFTDDHLNNLAKIMGKAPCELVKEDSEKRLKERGTDTEEKIKERSENAYVEHFWSLQSEYVIVNPHGEDDMDAWEVKVRGDKDKKERSSGVELVINQFYEIIRKYKNQKVFFVLNGPACVGKGPLENVFFNEIAEKEKLKIGKCILTVDENRPIRIKKNESDGNPYFFRDRAYIDSKCESEPNKYIPFFARSVKQMIDLGQVNELLISNDIVFLEIYYTAIPILKALY